MVEVVPIIKFEDKGIIDPVSCPNPEINSK